MQIQQMEENVAIHQTLGDNPNTDNGLTPDELKAKFDEGAVALKKFLNEKVVPLLNEHDDLLESFLETIGDLGDLDTNDKSSLVAAINEVLANGGGTPVDYYTVSYNGAGIVWSSAKPTIRGGTALLTTFTVADKYTLKSVEVLMGGVDITRTAYVAGQRTISIPAVTGDVSITVTTVKQHDFTEFDVKFYQGSVDDSTGVFTSGAVMTRAATDPVIDATNNSIAFKFSNSSEYISDSSAYISLNIYRYSASGEYLGRCTLAGEPTTQAWANKIYVDQSYSLQSGYKYRVYVAKPTSIVTNALFIEYLNSCTSFLISDGPDDSGLSVDADYAQDYGVMSASLTPDPSNKYLAGPFANAIISARNAWMLEYNGDTRKIPLIIHTDQHGRLTSQLSLFDFLSENINWYELSKIVNLGDVVGDHWEDADTEHPLTECAELEGYLSCYKNIPYSKRLDVFGNHDTWYHNAAGPDVVIQDQARLSRYFKNIYARRDNNAGYFTVCDDYFNVKYVVISCFEYTTSRSAFRISTKQMSWLIEELSKNDGYDVVIVSHVPLLSDPTKWIYPTGQTSNSTYRVSNVNTDDFFSARKTKGSGRIVDSEGVSHNYNFSGCTTDLLCSLHGHTHHDGYLYLNRTLLVNVFDWFADTTFFFVLIDRKNQRLDIWKVSNPNDTPLVQNYKVPFNSP